MSGYQLPRGWAQEAIGELFDVNPGKPPADLFPAATPVSFVPMGAVDAASGVITQPQECPFGKVRSGYTSFASGDVILAKITPCFENGKAAVARELRNGLGFGSSEFHVLRPRGAVLAEYLFHFIRQQCFRDEAAERMTGTAGQARVPVDYLKEVELPFPPLAEQHRLVGKVEALLARVNAISDRLAKVPVILKRFRQAVLAAACSGRLTEDWLARKSEEAWTSSNVDSVCELVVDCPHSTPKWTERGEVCLRTTNFSVRGLDLSEVRYVSRQTYEQRTARLAPRAGDVVYSREGGILGVACVIPKGLPACLGQRMMLMRCRPAVIRSEFLCYVLNSPVTLAVVRELTGGTASPHLNVGDIRQLAIPLPSLAEQDEIVGRVHALLALTDSIERRVAAATADGDKLRQAIMTKAFRGELVPTEAELARQEGREYEPASVLLERVRMDRAAATRYADNWRPRRVSAGAKVARRAEGSDARS